MKKYLNKKSRLVIGVEGTPLFVRVVPHKTDANLLVLKSPFVEGAQYLLDLAKVPAVQTWKGSNFFLTTVVKAEFLGALPGALGTLEQLIKEAPEVSEYQTEQETKAAQQFLLEVNGAGEIPEC
jgi:hypothetical protein